jgi:hypothetical protein
MFHLAVPDYLRMGSLDEVDWRFAEQAEIPARLWLLYGRPENAEVNR